MPFVKNHFPCSFLQGFLPSAFLRGFIPKPSFRNLFRIDLPQNCYLEPFPGGFSCAFFCIDGFHGLFRRVVFKGLSRANFFGALFSGPYPWTFLRGRLPCALSLGLFWNALSWSLFILHSFVSESSMISPAGVLSLLSFAGASLRNIFRRASYAWSPAELLPWASSSWKQFP